MDEQQGEQGQDSDLVRQLRKQLKDQGEELGRLRASVQERVIADAGLDPSLGVVKRLAKDYEGDWTPDAFKSFAIAEGLTVPDTSTQLPDGTQQQAPPAVADLSATEQQRLAATARVQQVLGATVPDTTPTLQDQIAQAEATGNTMEALRLKGLWAESVRTGVTPSP